MVTAPKAIKYSQTGVNYDALDTLKRLAQKHAGPTAAFIERFGLVEVTESRGESSYVWEEGDCYRALVIEGLGTKNLIADALRPITDKTYYDSLAQDTVAMIVNDLVVVGAEPQVISAYFAVGTSEWFLDERRTEDLVTGWAHACELAGATWGGGETPGLKGIIEPGAVDLAGSCIGIIRPRSRLTSGRKIKSGDAIVAVESSGVHANGLSMARAVAASLPQGYATPLPDGILFGEALLRPTHIYARLVRECFGRGVDIHYMVNVTGHGWRKLMRAKADVSYVIDTLPEPPSEFAFIQFHSGNDDREMYGNFNMGVGFVLYVPEHQASMVIAAAKAHQMKAWRIGTVEPGPRQVLIKPKNIIFSEGTLQVR